MPATRDDLFARLDRLGIESRTHDHPPLHTVEESIALRGDIPGAHCKNLFLKDRKGVLWLVVALENTPVDLKRLPKRIGSARLSFGNADLLMTTLGVVPGSVTPFGLINDTERSVRVVLEAALLDQDLVNFHPLVNNATTSLRPIDLVAFVRDCGHDPVIAPLDALPDDATPDHAAVAKP